MNIDPTFVPPEQKPTRRKYILRLEPFAFYEVLVLAQNILDQMGTEKPPIEDSTLRFSATEQEVQDLRKSLEDWPKRMYTIRSVGKRQDRSLTKKTELRKHEGGWFVRCESGGRPLELSTAYPLPREERNAAKIIARHDLTRVSDPRNAALVWLERCEVLETHDLAPVANSSTSLDKMDARLERRVMEASARGRGLLDLFAPGEEAGRNKDSRDE